MTSPHRTVPAALLALVLAAPAAAAEKGVWWEMTSEMEMVGMPFKMPATTLKVCQAEGEWKKPPEGKKDENCQVKDMKTSGNTMTWRMVCTGKEKMEGEGEMTRSGDTFTGRTHVKMDQGEMTIKMHGKKVGGACDPEEQKKKAEAQVEKYQAQAKDMEARSAAVAVKQCDDAIEQMQGNAVAGGYVFCKDPAKKKAFCDRLRTHAGFSKAMEQAPMEKSTGGNMPGPVAASKACGLELEAVKKDLCVEAGKKELLAFLAPFCPAEAKLIAKRECAGRDYTALSGSKYRNFCARVAGDKLEAADGEEQPAKPSKKKKEDTVDQGKKLLKGVLGF